MPVETQAVRLSKRQKERALARAEAEARRLEEGRAKAQSQLTATVQKIEALCLKLRTDYVRTHFKKQSKLANKRRILMQNELQLQRFLGLGATAN